MQRALLEAPDAWDRAKLAAAQSEPRLATTEPAPSETEPQKPTTEDVKPIENQTAATPPSPEPAQTPVSLVLINPADSGGEIHYLLDANVHTLRPGQSQDLPGERRWQIHFHRGASFGDALYSVSGGTYKFHVTPRGWELSRVDAPR
jgi:hypothetical protein